MLIKKLWQKRWLTAGSLKGLKSLFKLCKTTCNSGFCQPIYDSLWNNIVPVLCFSIICFNLRVRFRFFLVHHFCPDSFQTLRTVPTLNGEFLDLLDSFQTVQIFSGLSEQFSDSLAVSRLYGQFLDCLESFQTVLKVSRLPWKFPDCPESF